MNVKPVMIRSLWLLIPLLAYSASAADLKPIFNGKDLTGWSGHAHFWSVRDGVIHGETTAEKPTAGNTFLIWDGGEIADFEFRAKVRFKGNNSGVQYRSEIVDPANFALKGYQADLHPKPEYFGMLYGEKLKGRGIIAQRGQRVEAGADGKVKVVGKVEMTAALKDWEWNEIRVVAVGNRLVHMINGKITTTIVDNHPEAAASGKLGLQLHGGPPMTVEFKDLRLAQLKGPEAANVLKEALTGLEAKPAPAAKPAPVAKPVPAAKPAPVAKPAPAAKPAVVAAAPADTWLTAKPRPQWIWGRPDAEVLFFRKTVLIPGGFAKARLYATGDNQLTLWINDQLVGESPAWPQPIEIDVSQVLKPGLNQLALRGANQGGPAGAVFKLELTGANGLRSHVLSDPGWRMSAEGKEGWTGLAFNDDGWGEVRTLGRLGVGPWGIPGHVPPPVAAAPPVVKPSPMTEDGVLAPEGITVPDGFEIELVYTVPKETQGSWVSLAKDDRGRIYACDQGKMGLFRITPGSDPLKVEKAPVNLSGAQGMLWHEGSLYCNVNGGSLHRVYDSNRNDRLDTAEPIPSATGGGEHGNHGLAPAPGGKTFFIAGGNHANLPSTLSGRRVPTWKEDLLLPRQWDGRGHARGRLAPGGWVNVFDPARKTQEVYCIGFRNEYDVALNSHGDLFTFDADMEWDMGMPWYRPTRICLVASGGDYGWRSGTGKWPSYYEDSLPPVVDIGPGSPTGMASGAGARFPKRYQQALYALDWTFGTIYAIHLQPKGAGYTAEAEPFCFGSPLPVTDAVIGDDGALYFAIGGRSTQSALYRITYTGEDSVAPSERAEEGESAKARALRRQLEAFHGKDDLNAVPFAWPHLASEDRFLRHAARIAIESQPVERWAAGVYYAKDPQTRITGAVALARSGNTSHRVRIIQALREMDAASLSESRLLGLLRAYALTFTRLGGPSDAERKAVIAQLDPLFPHASAPANMELVRVLVYLRAPRVVGKTMRLIQQRKGTIVPDWTELASRNPRYGNSIQQMLNNHPPSQEIGYAFILRNLRRGWTLDQRRQYFTFLNEASRYQGGASYTEFLSHLRDEALGNCSDEEREKLAGLTGENFNPVPDFPVTPPKGPGEAWTLGSATRAAQLRKANFENGRNLFHATGCAACHRLDGMGGNIGPDLTSVPHKFDTAYLIESIIEPSKVISDQYGTSTVRMKDGETLIGLVVDQGDRIEVYPPVVDPKAIVVPRHEVAGMEPTPVSQMPPGMLNLLNADEVRDLVAYIMASGDPKAKVYR